MPQRIKLAFLLFSGVFTLVIGCGNPNQDLIENAPSITRRFDDDLGRTIALADTPKKVISLAPSITEIVYAIGAEDQLFANSHACDFPPEATELKHITTYPDVDVQTIVATNPDLVLVTTEVMSEKYTQVFDKVNTPVFFQTFQNVEDIYRNIETIGKMLGKEGSTNMLLDSLKGVEGRISAATADQIKYSTMILISIDPLIIVAGKSYITEMLEKAGGANAFSYLKEKKYSATTPEAILQANPEVIILPSEDDQVYQNLIDAYPVLYDVKAAQENRVYTMDPDLIYRPGPRFIEGLAQMTNILHSRFDIHEFFEGGDGRPDEPTENEE